MLTALVITVALVTSAGDGYVETYAKARTAQRAGRHAEAVPLFERALQLEAESEAAFEGLLTSLIALEAWDRAADVGDRALALDPDSERFRAQTAYAKRRAAQDDVTVRAYVAAFGSGYTGEALLRGQYGANLTASVRFPSGFSFLLGASAVESLYADQDAGSTYQVTPTFGLSYAAGNYYGVLSGTYVNSDDPGSNDTGVVGFVFGGGAADWGLSLGAALTVAPERTSVQLDPRVRLALDDRVVLEAGAQLQVHSTSWTDADGFAQRDDEVLGTFDASAVITLTDVLSLRLGIYGGARRHAVGAFGMTVYTGSERYRAGGSASLTWQAARWLALGVRLGADYGDEVGGESQEFTALGAGLFVDLRL